MSETYTPYIRNHTHIFLILERLGPGLLLYIVFFAAHHRSLTPILFKSSKNVNKIVEEGRSETATSNPHLRELFPTLGVYIIDFA